MSNQNRVILYGFWLSSCTWRVRAALYAKHLEFEERSVDIVKERAQCTDQYRAINPAQKVPVLTIDGVNLVESMAIVQYLEETRPEPTLLPTTALLRARMREICETVVSGIQPLQSFGLKHRFATDEEFYRFTKYWLERGLQTLDDLLRQSAERYCIGNQLTIADICLVPQLYNAVTRYQLDLKMFPTVFKVYENLMNEEVFQQTHPEKIQPIKST